MSVARAYGYVTRDALLICLGVFDGPAPPPAVLDALNSDFRDLPFGAVSDRNMAAGLVLTWWVETHCENEPLEVSPARSRTGKHQRPFDAVVGSP